MFLRFGLVGCGTIAETHARALANFPGTEARLTACCDILPEKAAAFADTFGLRAATWNALLTDPEIDALSICTPSGLHAELGVAALHAGKHVIVEKPMDVTHAACDRLRTAAQQTGKTLAVVSQHRFDPASRQVKAVMDEGTLGALVLAEARICWYRTQEYYDSGDWRGTWAMDGGGCLMNQGIHTVDLMLWLGGPVETVSAQMRTAAHRGIEVEDVVVATLTFRNGALGTLTASTAAYPGFAARLALHGTQGSAVIEGDSLQTLAIQGMETHTGQHAVAHALAIASGGTSSISHLVTDSLSDTSQWGDAHQAQFADFVRCCRTGQIPLVDGTEGRRAVALILAVYESARTGQVLVLPEEQL